MGVCAKRRATRLSAVVLAVTGGVGGSATPVQADVEGAGVCVLTIQLAGATPLLLPGSTTWGLSGGGTCGASGGDVVADATVSGSLNGLLDLPTTSCLVALADGTLTVTITSFGSFTGDLVVTASAAGPVALVAVTVGSSAAVGAFVQDPSDTKRCVRDNGAGTLTWKGVLGFVDLDA